MPGGVTRTRAETAPANKRLITAYDETFKLNMHGSTTTRCCRLVDHACTCCLLSEVMAALQVDSATQNSVPAVLNNVQAPLHRCCANISFCCRLMVQPGLHTCAAVCTPGSNLWHRLQCGRPWFFSYTLVAAVDQLHVQGSILVISKNSAAAAAVWPDLHRLKFLQLDLQCSLRLLRRQHHRKWVVSVTCMQCQLPAFSGGGRQVTVFCMLAPVQLNRVRDAVREHACHKQLQHEISWLCCSVALTIGGTP
jgi:hypothetical protein